MYGSSYDQGKKKRRLKVWCWAEKWDRSWRNIARSCRKKKGQQRRRKTEELYAIKLIKYPTPPQTVNGCFAHRRGARLNGNCRTNHSPRRTFHRISAVMMTFLGQGRCVGNFVDTYCWYDGQVVCIQGGIKVKNCSQDDFSAHTMFSLNLASRGREDLWLGPLVFIGSSCWLTPSLSFITAWKVDLAYFSWSSVRC